MHLLLHLVITWRPPPHQQTSYIYLLSIHIKYPMLSNVFLQRITWSSGCAPQIPCTHLYTHTSLHTHTHRGASGHTQTQEISAISLLTTQKIHMHRFPLTHSHTSGDFHSSLRRLPTHIHPFYAHTDIRRKAPSHIPFLHLSHYHTHEIRISIRSFQIRSYMVISRTPNFSLSTSLHYISIITQTSSDRHKTP